MTSGASQPETSRRLELACVAALIVIFICFTWRCLTMYFSDDDMLNMYSAWMTPALKLSKAQVLLWMPVSRPLGNGVYRLFYRVFGFHPLPLHIFCWLLLIGNVIAAWRFFRVAAPSVFIALVALALTLVHGLFQDLYLSAGTIYDQLCFLFTALSVTVYARMRRDGQPVTPGSTALTALLCLMAMNAKETGAMVPAILFCYECIFCLPDAWRQGRVRQLLRSVTPLYSLLTAMVAAFLFGRVRHTEGLIGNPAYHPHLSAVTWMTNVAEYMDIIAYRRLHFSAGSAALTLFAMLLLAGALRNRTMLFGWLYFVIAITPVALIPIRPGYVLYVPFPGLGLFFAALLGLAFGLARALRAENLNFGQAGVVAAIAALLILVHATHWPEPWVVSESPEWRLTDKMSRDYPSLKPGARILFVNDYPSNNGYDLMFNLRLLYHDPHLEVSRLRGSADQRPDRTLADYDHIFTTGPDAYAELDRRNVEESIRLNILRDYLPGRTFDTDRLDHTGYIVSGVTDSSRRGAGYWTARSARLKFDIYPADTTLTIKFWLPDFVATGEQRNLSVIVDGETIGNVALSHAGENTAEFHAPARLINPSGFTILEMNVDRPYVKDSQEYGVVLLRADFEYAEMR